MKSHQNHHKQVSPAGAILAVAAAYFLLGIGIAQAQEDIPVVENSLRGSMRRGPTMVEKAVTDIDGPEESLLFRPMNLIFDSEGNLFVADSGQYAILIFDRDGKFKSRIGGEGDGPGEFRMPATSYFSWEGELIVEDPGNQRRSFFSPEGEYLRSESLGPVFMSGSLIKTVPGEYVRPAQGAVIVRRTNSNVRMDEEEEDPGLMETVSGDGEVKLKIGTRKEHESPMIGILLNRVSLSFAPPDHIVAAFQNSNEIHIYNRNTGQLERIITRRLFFNPKEPEMEMRTENSTSNEGGQMTLIRAVPDTDPVSDDVVVDPEGRIWVLTHLTTSEAAEEKEIEGEYDGLIRIEIFSLEGELLTTLPLDFAPGMMAFDPFGDLWLIDTRETLTARRYEIEW